MLGYEDSKYYCPVFPYPDAKLTAKQIACLSITTQRNTFTCWNKLTGNVYHNFITWKDLRADTLVQQWNRSFKLRYNHFEPQQPIC